jgi:hypothetical protein
MGRLTSPTTHGATGLSGDGVLAAMKEAAMKQLHLAMSAACEPALAVLRWEQVSVSGWFRVEFAVRD